MLNPAEKSGPGAPAIDARLRRSIDDLRHLDGVIGLLGWDEETYLPVEGRPQRGAQLATLEGLRHRLLVSDELRDLIGEATLDTAADPLAGAELKRLQRLRGIAIALPDELVRQYARTRSRCLAAWEVAFRDDDFSVFAGPFAEMLALVRERAQALAQSDDLYDPLLDEFEPGMTRAHLEPVLDKVAARLTPLVAELAETTKSAPPLPQAEFPDTEQTAFCRRVLTDMGFDFNRGRVDLSTHPFTQSTSHNDVRMTIRIDPYNPMPSLFVALHEGGHSLYEQGFDKALCGTLLAEAPSAGLHESQARLWENHVGRRLGFWTHYLPAFQRHFPGAFDDWTPGKMVESINVVRPDFKRVEADELTYNLHIILRYQLEQALVSGDLDIAGLPGAWNELSERLLGICPRTAREGCLQDVHWSAGMFGYFPTYLLGNLYAAQLIESHTGQHDLDANLARGDLQTLTGWLRDSVQSHGWSMSVDEILINATGRGLDPEPYFRAIDQRFRGSGSGA